MKITLDDQDGQEKLLLETPGGEVSGPGTSSRQRLELEEAGSPQERLDIGRPKLDVPHERVIASASKHTSLCPRPTTCQPSANRVS